MGEVPPNATSANATSSAGAEQEDQSASGAGGKPKDEGISSGAFRSSNETSPPMTDGAFRRKEEEFDPTSRDYSRPTLLKLEALLSSHYLPGVGAFEYVTTTAEKYCEFGQLSKDAIREKIANCSGSDGSCGVVWGEEMPSKSSSMNIFTSREQPDEMVYDSIYRSRSDLNPVDIPELDISVTGGVANFSSKNCTDCECTGKVESAQPFLEWQI